MTDNSPARDDERYEVASPEWLAAKTQTVVKYFSEVDLTGITFSFSQEYTDVPDRLRVGDEPIGYYWRVVDGAVEVGQHVIDADLNVSCEFEAAIPLSRIVIGDDPEAMKTGLAMMAEAQLAGKYRRIGVEPTFVQLEEPQLKSHDDMARRTL